jgi:hypothetical protein
MPEFTGVITEPGLYPDIPESEYHNDPVVGGSLSVTSSKLLLPPSVPAKFKWARDHPHVSTRAMDLGSTVHALVLGTGPEIIELDYDDWRTKAAKEQRDVHTDEGYLVMLRKDYLEARAIADALLTHPTAGGLLQGVDPEVSMFWEDGEFGIWLRGRMDAMTLAWQMPTIVDVKTSKDASPDAFAKSVADFGYHRQDVHYREGLAACLGCDPGEIDFVFAVVETEPPYLVATYRVDAAAADVGREQNRIAREVYAACAESGIWPGYSEEIEDLSLPYFKRREMERHISEWHD